MACGTAWVTETSRQIFTTKDVQNHDLRVRVQVEFSDPPLNDLRLDSASDIPRSAVEYEMGKLTAWVNRPVWYIFIFKLADNQKKSVKLNVQWSKYEYPNSLFVPIGSRDSSVISGSISGLFPSFFMIMVKYLS